jgi:hypothetical protein
MTQQQHRLSGQSCESGVSSSSSRQSYHSGSGINGVSGGPPSSSSNGSSSSQGSLDRLEESGYSSTANVHELLQQGHSVCRMQCTIYTVKANKMIGCERPLRWVKSIDIQETKG